MSTDNIDQHPSQAPITPSHSNDGALHIPESVDGYFGYGEERSLQQVHTPTSRYNDILTITRRFIDR